MGIDANSVEATYTALQGALAKVLPDAEIRYKAELIYEINRKKKERGALILGHNYMEPALYYGVTDIVGDSLELSRKAAETDSKLIVFCGVRFMAETAKILNPAATVLIPAKKAGCSLAASITAKDVRELREKYPGLPVVSYVNVYADVKAEVDVCCTSSNANKIVDSLKSDAIIFLPDEYLARNVAAETGRQIMFPNGPVPKGQPVLVGWKGRCEVHEQFSVEDIQNVRAQFPDVTVLAHPECHPDVVAASDFSASTTKMVDFVKQSKAPRFLLLTECSMGDNIIAENPEKDVLRLCSIRCPHMNEITLEDTLSALEKMQYVVEVPEDVRIRAKRSLDRMLAVH